MHILIGKAKKYKKGDNNSLKDFNYDIQAGHWKSMDGQLLISCTNFLRPQSKKNDIETGEDRKGE
jgi:hypothetical protein